jgi:esterase/lipase/1-acyl-sn-glycerol-3-phosphate acyltransferase
MSDIAYHSTKFMLNMMETIFKTNIHISGLENFDSEKPTLFVANHFTRFETLLMPYAIHKHTDVQVRSLAHKSLFIGLLGHYLEETGTLSTGNEHRNEIIIGDLMTGRKNWLIYPEGNMIKNKQITMNKEFIMHTDTRHAGIYTGAAVLALKAQMLKQEYRIALKEGDSEKAEALRNTYRLENDDLAYNSIKIVPVNITYLPIRPGANPMMKMASLFIGDDQSDALMEELEIEGNLLSNAEMHIHFDKAIGLESYLHHADAALHHNPAQSAEQRHHHILQEHRHTLTTLFMDRIYKNVLLGFDHIFIGVLHHYRYENITANQLRRAIFLVAREVEELGMYRLHEPFMASLLELIGEDRYEYFDSALQLALSQKLLIEIEPGHYKINKSMLFNKFSFHTLRLRNTFKVIWNEIALLEPLSECIVKVMAKEPCDIVEEIFYRLYRKDLETYNDDYNRFYTVIGSKAKSVGKPFILYKAENETGIVLSHGYMSTPEQVRPMAEKLFEAGINVYGVRLKGHGTMPEDLRDTTYRQWYDSFNIGYAALKQVCKHIFVGGFSTGGLLALVAASRKYDHIDGVICINSAMKLKDMRAHYVVPTLNVLNDFFGLFNADVDVVDYEPEYPEMSYTKHYLSSIDTLRQLMDHTYDRLPMITAPTLVIQADQDPIVSSKSATIIHDRLSSEYKELYSVDSDHHVIVQGGCSDIVFKKVDRFIKRQIEERPRRREGDD